MDCLFCCSRNSKVKFRETQSVCVSIIHFYRKCTFFSKRLLKLKSTIFCNFCLIFTVGTKTSPLYIGSFFRVTSSWCSWFKTALSYFLSVRWSHDTQTHTPSLPLVEQRAEVIRSCLTLSISISNSVKFSIKEALNPILFYSTHDCTDFTRELFWSNVSILSRNYPPQGLRCAQSHCSDPHTAFKYFGYNGIL